MTNHRYLILLISILSASCNLSNTELSQKNIEYSGPDLEVINLNTSFSDSARTRFSLKADLYQVFNDGKELYPSGLKMDIFSKEDKSIKAKFSANYVIRNSEENFYRAEGNVILYNIDTENELRTEELFWYPNEEKFSTNKFVTIKSENEIHSGEGMVSNQDFTEYEILKPSGIIEIDED
ncbi:MAG: LPS export ABC transporter periplasmic protein LptC [Flammeovirgaceae bacterium]|jgi:LPS export ABC transporter protein LptC|nr:LPS export ABC transporter periplasmic protein LptC [Flammeovirgaceae bacterium]|tara:strand:+ start:424 stop:963 length:540 start_codon:yes stop_codon:yes gene_type:complete